MEFTLKYGFLGLRKVKLRFDLAALRAATRAARMDLGEFFTSEKLTDNDRLFYTAYGAWLKGDSVSVKNLAKFAKFWLKLKVKHIEQVRVFRNQSDIVSKEFREALNKTAESKKKLH